MAGLLRRRSCSSFLALLLLLCASSHLLPTSSQAFTINLRGAGYGAYDDEKVPLDAVIVPDPSPELSGPLLAPAPPPVVGGGGDDMRPRLPTERWRRRGSTRPGGEAAARRAAAAPTTTAAAPWAGGGPARAPAQAPAPESGMSIKSSPAVPVPRGVTDTATVLPMPAPGEKRQEVGAAGSSSVQQGKAGVVLPLLLGFIVMMAAF